MIYLPAVQSCKIQVWASAAFSLANPAAWGILDRAMQTPSSRWSWFAGNHVEFLTRATKTKSLVGLVTQAEHAAFPRGLCQCMAGAGFLRLVSRIDPRSPTCDSCTSRGGG